MASQNNITAWAKEHMRDGAGFVTDDQVNSAQVTALATYNRHRPRMVSTSTAGDGGFDYALPASWSVGLSVVVDVEYPSGEQDPAILDRNAYRIYDNGTVAKLRFLEDSPAATEAFIVRYTASHAIGAGDDEAGTTIPACDVRSFAQLVAGVCLRQLAARSAQSRDSTLDADAVDYGGASRVYNTLADELIRAYREHVGVSDDEGEGGVRAAVTFADIDLDLQWGAERLFHGRLWS